MKRTIQKKTGFHALCIFLMVLAPWSQSFGQKNILIPEIGISFTLPGKDASENNTGNTRTWNCTMPKAGYSIDMVFQKNINLGNNFILNYVADMKNRAKEKGLIIADISDPAPANLSIPVYRFSLQRNQSKSFLYVFGRDNGLLVVTIIYDDVNKYGNGVAESNKSFLNSFKLYNRTSVYSLKLLTAFLTLTNDYKSLGTVFFNSVKSNLVSYEQTGSLTALPATEEAGKQFKTALENQLDIIKAIKPVNADEASFKESMINYCNTELLVVSTATTQLYNILNKGVFDNNTYNSVVNNAVSAADKMESLSVKATYREPVLSPATNTGGRLAVRTGAHKITNKYGDTATLLPFTYTKGMVEVTQTDISSLSGFDLSKFSFLGIYLGMTRQQALEQLKQMPMISLRVDGSYSIPEDLNIYHQTFLQVSFRFSNGSSLYLGGFTWKAGEEELSKINLNRESAYLFAGKSRNLFNPDVVKNNKTAYTKFLTGPPEITTDQYNRNQTVYSYPAQGISFVVDVFPSDKSRTNVDMILTK